MKIKITETEIEADARELREDNTLSDNLLRLTMLARAVQSHKPSDEEENEEDE